MTRSQNTTSVPLNADTQAWLVQNTTRTNNVFGREHDTHAGGEISLPPLRRGSGKRDAMGGDGLGVGGPGFTSAMALPALGEDDEMEDGEEHEREGGEFGEETGGVGGGKAFGDDDDRRVSEDGSTHSLTLRGGSLGSSSVQARRVSVAHNTLDMSSKNIQVRTD